MANNFELNLEPDSWVPPTSASPGRGVILHRPYWAFDASAEETLKSKSFRMPTSYTGSGTLKLDIFYAMASATSGNVDFEVAVEAITPDDALDTDAAESFDSDNAAVEAVPGTAGHMSVLSVTLTSKDSVAAGDLVRLKLTGTVPRTSTGATGDARVYACCLREEA